MKKPSLPDASLDHAVPRFAGGASTQPIAILTRMDDEKWSDVSIWVLCAICSLLVMLLLAMPSIVGWLHTR
jgi:hypothetical protein